MRVWRQMMAGLRRLLSDARGHAMTETVIMLPVFIIIFGGLLYTHQRYRSAINMAQYTRAHAWQYAYSSCEENPGGQTALRVARVSSDGEISGIVSLLFAEGIIPGMNFDEIEAEREASVDRPAVLGEGTVTVRHKLLITCNERREADGDFFTDAWDMFVTN